MNHRIEKRYKSRIRRFAKKVMNDRISLALCNPNELWCAIADCAIRNQTSISINRLERRYDMILFGYKDLSNNCRKMHGKRMRRRKG